MVWSQSTQQTCQVCDWFRTVWKQKVLLKIVTLQAFIPWFNPLPPQSPSLTDSPKLNNYYLFLLIIFKYMDSSHLFQYLTWEVFGVFI